METNISKSLRLPAEWEPQSGVMLTWPHADTDWRPYIDEVENVYVELSHIISMHEDVLIASACPMDTAARLRRKLSERQMERVHIVHVPCNDTWTRDHGPITLVPEHDGSDGAVCLDFRFNGWGEKFPSSLDNAINGILDAQGTVGATWEHHLDFVLEGGSIECDGHGTVLTTSQCLLAPKRNQPLTKEQIELRLKKYLRVERILWLDYGKLIGDDTDGHIDTIARFAPDDTIVYVRCDDKDDVHYTDFKAMEKQLEEFRTKEKKPYRLLPLPQATPAMYEDERLPATYANFLVINNAVVFPKYGCTKTDDEAAEVLSVAFPERKIIGIDARVLIRQHGSIHCITMQLPKELNINS